MSSRLHRAETPAADALRKVCAWCQPPAPKGHAGVAAAPVSHGICPSCAQRLKRDFERERRP